VGVASDNSRSSAIILLPVIDALPGKEERVGPGVELAEGAKGFLAKNRASSELTWVGEDGRLHLLTRRRFTSISKFLDEILESRLDKVGVSKSVAKALKDNGSVLRGEKLRKEAAKKPWLKRGLAQTLSDSVGT
jgi:tRNA nucleotidyltransferase (CCA-adding enzyme)